MSKAVYGESYVKYTSISKYNSQAFVMVQEGFGSLESINKLDSPDFIDILEHLEIRREIEAYEINKEKNK